MPGKKTITIRLEPGDYERLTSEARRLQMSSASLARLYLRAALDGLEGPAQARCRSGIAALSALARLRERLADGEPEDAVALVRRGRDDLDQRTAL